MSGTAKGVARARRARLVGAAFMALAALGVRGAAIAWTLGVVLLGAGIGYAVAEGWGWP